MKTRKQKGGKQQKLYMTLNQLNEAEIESIFCDGKKITDLPKSDPPLFILKWGPPGSGKSSAKVTEIIENVGKKPIDSFINFSSDEIVESLLLFRHETSLEKAKELRIRANVHKNIKDYVHAKEILQEEKGKIQDGQLKKEIEKLLSDWESGKDVPEEWKTSGEFDRLLQEIVLKRTSNIYVKYRKTFKNTNTKKSLYEKMNSVLLKAYAENVNILYETMGSGYGLDDKKIRINDRTARRLARGKEQKPILVFENTWENLLGKIEYNEATREPIRYDISDLPEAVPENYKIIVVYPILNGEIIKTRALKRSIRMFTEPSVRSFEDPIGTYKTILTKFASEIHNTLSGNSMKKIQLESLIDSYIEEEKKELGYESDNNSYISFIQELIQKISEGESTIPYPMYRALPIQKIYDTIEEAFKYSVDYFLKQYLFLGRIEQVIYVSTLFP